MMAKRGVASQSDGTATGHSLLTSLTRIPATDYFKVQKLSLFWRVRNYTLLSYVRLSNLYELASSIESRGIGGSFVECGVSNGGSAGVIASVAKRSPRHVWLFDSWEGMPEPGPYDIDRRGAKGRKGDFAGSQGRVRELLFDKLKLSGEYVHLVKGWFERTIPMKVESIRAIALLHLDCDWYEPVLFCLAHLYDRVVEGGFVVVDDYGEWSGCKKAVDEFRAKVHPQGALVQVDDTGVYFRK